MAAAPPSRLHITADERDDVRVLTIDGVLDCTTFRSVRDSIIKAALDDVSAVIADVSGLQVPSLSALAVFTSARWQLSRWPGVPLLLVCGHPAGRHALVRNGVTRYVAVHDDVATALAATGAPDNHPVWRRVREELPTEPCAVERAHALIIDCLLEWSHQGLIAAAKAIAQELVNNAFEHTVGTVELLLEDGGSTVTVAVADDSTLPASVPEPTSDRPKSGLELVRTVSRAWGSVPSLNGKTVWATIADEDG